MDFDAGGGPETGIQLGVTLASLVPRPSPAPVFDRLQYTASDQKLEPGKAWERTASDQKLEPGKAWERG